MIKMVERKHLCCILAVYIEQRNVGILMFLYHFFIINGMTNQLDANQYVDK